MDLREYIVSRIDAGYAEKSKADKARTYIGASSIGNQCDAYLAFCLRGFPGDTNEPKAQRIFNLGHIVEDIVVKDLKTKAKVHVMEVDPVTGKQYSYSAYGGHALAHLDGIIIDPISGAPMVLEVKSMNERKFNDFKKLGVRKSHPSYYYQCVMAMGLSGMRNAVLIAYCKNNSEYHLEVIEQDDLEWHNLKARIETAMQNEAKKITGNADDWRCRFCFKRGVCWGDMEVPQECRTCQHAIPAEGHRWYCEKHKRPADKTCADWVRYQPLSKE